MIPRTKFRKNRLLVALKKDYFNYDVLLQLCTRIIDQEGGRLRTHLLHHAHPVLNVI